ncbi:MAG TPA: radical SAM family heme chaperone HemW [Micropepsaceae bacterium]|nr:radical SAM family heme chaperone HemW [Micropepsaceae bacterium]
MSDAPGFALYVHWPFCAAKCPYCDFNSHVRRNIDAMDYGSGLVRELETQAGMLDARPQLSSIFFGGGTPSLMPPQAVAGVIDAAAKLFSFAPDIEITLEANPTSADAARFAGYRTSGVNRLSLGVQALNDADLKALGRWHSADEAMAALSLARETFPRVSFDLIYARMGQTREGWADELQKALALMPDHLSLYQLTIEDGTPFAALHARGQIITPDDDEAAAQYALTQELCEAAGLPAYEISNHARAGAASRHNLVYWRYGEYLGIGPGAHGRIRTRGALHATVTEKRPEEWLARVKEKGAALTQNEGIAPTDQAREMMMMGLRLTEGIDPARYERLAGAPLDHARIAHLAAEGFLERNANRLRATRKGRLVLNALIAELVG